MEANENTPAKMVTTTGEEVPRRNMFANTTSFTELVHQVVGAASMAWENVAGAGVFDDVHARKVAADAEDEIRRVTGYAGE